MSDVAVQEKDTGDGGRVSDGPSARHRRRPYLLDIDGPIEDLLLDYRQKKHWLMADLRWKLTLSAHAPNGKLAEPRLDGPSYIVADLMWPVEEHPFIGELFRMTDRLSGHFARNCGNPQLAALLSEESYLRLIAKAEKYVTYLHIKHVDGKWETVRFAEFFADWDERKGASVSTHLGEMIKYAWKEVTDRAMEEEAQIHAALHRMTLEDARIVVRAELAADQKKYAKGEINQVPQRGAQLLSFEQPSDAHGDPRLPDSHTGQPVTLFESEQGRAMSGATVGDDFSHFRTPLRSPLRVAAMANAFEQFGDALIGLNVGPDQNGRDRILGTNEAFAWNAYWACVPEQYDEFINISIDNLATKLGYTSKDQLRGALDRAKGVWLNPPIDNEHDDDKTRNTKHKVRALAARCMALSVPSTWRRRLSDEAVKKLIEDGRTTLIQGMVRTEGAAKGKQPFQLYRSVIHAYIEEHLIVASD